MSKNAQPIVVVSYFASSRWLFSWKEGGIAFVQVTPNLKAAQHLEQWLNEDGVVPQISRLRGK